ncbi:hydroxyethylthiazole kinase [uncultured Anaerococcus sp.]|uniref:hydroxyethylthiazole kinase n=1 Tax=uncultured Anaerococcus sp. TaxID=293428 RepID=UPI002614C10F|nr:hydroxyethylthiazole kinase [uncultured Anaerococcus sp.]
MIDFDKTFDRLMEETHTIHSIVSPLIANDAANVLLNLNQSPFMAEYYREVYEITKNSDALLVNLGTLNEIKLKGIKESLKSAKDNNIPISLDPVGASATKIRLDASLYYLNNYPINILKGNYSELFSIYHKKLSTKGVDSGNINNDELIKITRKLSTMYNTIVVATGKEDIISYKEETLIFKNGSDYLTKITGTGCMLGAIIAACSSFQMNIESVALAVSIMNIAGEEADKSRGMASFKISLLDEISLISKEKIKERLMYERL